MNIVIDMSRDVTDVCCHCGRSKLWASVEARQMLTDNCEPSSCQICYDMVPTMFLDERCMFDVCPHWGVP